MGGARSPSNDFVWPVSTEFPAVWWSTIALSFRRYDWLFSLSEREVSPGNRSNYKSTRERVDSKGLYGRWRLHLMGSWTCPKCRQWPDIWNSEIFLFSISFVFSLELVMIMNNLIYNFIIEAFQGRVWKYIFYSGTKWQLKSFFQSPDGKFWLLPSVH